MLNAHQMQHPPLQPVSATSSCDKHSGARWRCLAAGRDVSFYPLKLLPSIESHKPPDRKGWVCSNSGHYKVNRKKLAGEAHAGTSFLTLLNCPGLLGYVLFLMGSCSRSENSCHGTWHARGDPGFPPEHTNGAGLSSSVCASWKLWCLLGTEP